MTNHKLRSRQLNPCDDLFWKCRGYPKRPYDWQEILIAQDEEKKRRERAYLSNSNNPNNALFWLKKGFNERPSNWRDLFYDMYHDSS